MAGGSVCFREGLRRTGLVAGRGCVGDGEMIPGVTVLWFELQDAATVQM